jgi:ketosteroid isomerase-like protein
MRSRRDGRRAAAPRRAWILAAILGFAAAGASLAEPSLTAVAERALQARTAAMQENATAADVDRFLAFAADGVVYEDPVARMKIEGKDSIRKGMTAFLGATRNARAVVTGRIAADGVVVLQEEVSFEERQDDGTWMPRHRRQVTLFEFEAGKIRRIADYWARPG